MTRASGLRKKFWLKRFPTKYSRLPRARKVGSIVSPCGIMAADTANRLSALISHLPRCRPIAGDRRTKALHEENCVIECAKLPLSSFFPSTLTAAGPLPAAASIRSRASRDRWATAPAPSACFRCVQQDGGRSSFEARAVWCKLKRPLFDARAPHDDGSGFVPAETTQSLRTKLRVSSPVTLQPNFRSSSSTDASLAVWTIDLIRRWPSSRTSCMALVPTAAPIPSRIDA
jgi:hypothetical protein